MIIRTTGFVIVVLLALLGCSEDTERPDADSAAVGTDEDWSFVRMHDTLEMLLSEARSKDTIEFQSAALNPFLFFKSGHIVTEKEKHAIAIYYASDTTVWVELYSISANGYGTQNSNLELPGPGIGFDVKLADYNFDGINDVYMNETCSNGISLCAGYLLITDSARRSFVYHPEARRLHNMKPLTEEKKILSDYIYECHTMHMTCKTTHVWQGDTIVPVGDSCDCK